MNPVLSMTCDGSENACVIRLEGELDITCSTELKQVLLEAITSGKTLQVDLSRVTDLDVTALQLLWAAKSEAENAGTALAFTGEGPDNIRSTAAEAGFEDFAPAPPPPAPPANSPASSAESADD